MIHQAMCPSGVPGMVLAVAMEWLNRPACRRAASLIEPAGPGVLEIGFGTGALLSMLARGLQGGLFAGVDPSPLMVRWARRRLARVARQVHVDLRQGSDQDLDWPPASFAHVAALHSFQFWPRPQATLRRIRQLLRADGQLLLVLRSHSRPARLEWLPNPLSRSADEIAGTLAALESAGFRAMKRHSDVGSSAVLTAGLGAA